MKKGFILALFGLTHLAFASTSSNITYPTVIVPRNQEVVFDLQKGSPAGMKENVKYDLTCDLTANQKIGIALIRPNPFMYWSHVILNGQAHPFADTNQFEIEPKSVLTLNSIVFNDFVGFPNSTGKLNIINLDHDHDLLLKCTAVPNYS